MGNNCEITAGKIPQTGHYTYAIEWQHVTSQALCNHFRGAKEYGFPRESEYFVAAHLLKRL